MYDLDDSEVCVGYLARDCSGWGGDRWRFSSGFPAGQRLFNYAKASQANGETGRLLVVEGVPDALRCIEAGFPETVALLGSSLLGPQTERLRAMRLDHVVVVADNDDAGKKLARHLKQLFSAQVVEPPADFKDIGEMSSELARAFLRSALVGPERGAA
jgi:5S rRNA maturation endonuclease (ribonuclease M5)